MLIKKILETYLDINNSKDIYSNNIDQLLLDKLNEKFVGICYSSCLILKINKIIRRSYIYMKDTLDGNANISISFEVDCIIYLANEIINGCKIIKKEPNGIIHATSKYTGIQLNIQSQISIFNEGDIIPIIVKKVRYNIGQNSISVLAVPFMPITPTIEYYNITGSLNKQQIELIDSLISEIKTLEDKFKKLNANDKKIYNFFISLLDYDKDKGIPKSKNIEITNITKINSGVVFTDFSKYDNNKINYIENNTDKKINIIDESPFVIYNVVLFNYLSRLQTLQNFLEYYPTFAEVQKYKNVWKFYSMLKK
jgi:hypothetical protein